MIRITIVTFPWSAEQLSKLVSLNSLSNALREAVPVEGDLGVL